MTSENSSLDAYWSNFLTGQPDAHAPAFFNKVEVDLFIKYNPPTKTASYLTDFFGSRQTVPDRQKALGVGASGF